MLLQPREREEQAGGVKLYAQKKRDSILMLKTLRYVQNIGSQVVLVLQLLIIHQRPIHFTHEKVFWHTLK